MQQGLGYSPARARTSYAVGAPGKPSEGAGPQPGSYAIRAVDLRAMSE